jgi:DNA polymerase/3'-5' exonuclease PolX
MPSPELQGKTVEQLFAAAEAELGIAENNVVKRGNGQTAFYANSEYGEWHVDFFYVPEESWGAGILFASGPAGLNIAMRSLAKSRGMKLNRFGLSKLDGELVASQTEEEIFAALGINFQTPEMRESKSPEAILRELQLKFK